MGCFRLVSLKPIAVRDEGLLSARSSHSCATFFRPIPAGRSQQSFSQRTVRGSFPIDSIPQPLLSDCESESRQANEATNNDFYGNSGQTSSTFHYCFTFLWERVVSSLRPPASDTLMLCSSLGKENSI